MAIVCFSGELLPFTGEERTETEASAFRDNVAELVQRYDRLDKEKLMGMAIAIDGVIVHTPLLEVIDPDSELHFLHRISGG